MATRTQVPNSPRYTPARAREQRIAQWATLGTYAVLGIAAVLLVVALVDQFIIRPRQAVARVAGVTITRERYDRYYDYRLWSLQRTISILEGQRVQMSTDEALAALVPQIDQQITQIGYEIQMLPSEALEDLIDSELIRQEAERRGLTVTDDEVQREIESFFGYDPDPDPAPAATPEPTPTAEATPTGEATATPAPEETPQPTPTLGPTPTPTPTEAPMTREEFETAAAEWFTAVRQGAGLREGELRELIRGDILQRKLVESLRAEVPTTAEQIHARHIVLGTEEDARAALERLQAGEDFAALAAEVSTDTLTKDEGGDLGWLPRGARIEAFDEVAFALEVGGRSEVVQVGSAWEIIEVLEREADRELEEDDLARVQNLAVSDWFGTARTSPDIERLLDVPPAIIQ